MGRIVRVGLLYFLIVGAAGFILGTIRMLWLLPRLGERWAELLEMPLMLAVIYFAAQWVARKLAGMMWQARLGAGLTALALLLAMEVGLVLQLRGLTISEYWTSRDPVSGTVYLASLVFFGVAPALLPKLRTLPFPHNVVRAPKRQRLNR